MSGIATHSIIWRPAKAVATEETEKEVLARELQLSSLLSSLSDLVPGHLFSSSFPLLLLHRVASPEKNPWKILIKIHVSSQAATAAFLVAFALLKSYAWVHNFLPPRLHWVYGWLCSTLYSRIARAERSSKAEEKKAAVRATEQRLRLEYSSSHRREYKRPLISILVPGDRQWIFSLDT